MLCRGVFSSVKSDGTRYFRASITYHSKHISLGSRSTAEEAALLYMEAGELLNGNKTLMDYTEGSPLPFDKWVVLVNYRDNGVYFRNPIYLNKTYFSYFLTPSIELKFDTDDLFYYSEHRIQYRGRHYYCENHGAQLSLQGRYGIHPYSVVNRDFRFVNGDTTDYRYANIEIINRYIGVKRHQRGYTAKYRAFVHIKGVWLIGTFDTEAEAAIAYNKAQDFLIKKGLRKNALRSNYIEELSGREYAEIYTEIHLPKKFREHVEKLAKKP